MIPLPCENEIVETRYCPHCDADLPLADFGVSRTRADGLARYCRKSNREKTALQREREAIDRTTRKPMVFAKQMPKDLRARIKWAIKIKGATNRNSIQRTTKIRWDDLCDLLATMTFDDNELSINRVTGKFSVAA